MNELHEEDGNVARAISEMTETLLLGRACMWTARYETPRKSEMAIPPITSSVVAAFRPCGRRKAATPFEIASTPVKAAAPDENARRTTRTPTAPAPAAIGSGTTTCAQLPAAHLPIPVPIIAYMTATKAYVGMAKRIPDSRTPRRLTSVRITTNTSESCTLCESREGAADTSATTPAVTETATVRM